MGGNDDPFSLQSSISDLYKAATEYAGQSADSPGPSADAVRDYANSVDGKNTPPWMIAIGAGMAGDYETANKYAQLAVGSPQPPYDESAGPVYTDSNGLPFQVVQVPSQIDPNYRDSNDQPLTTTQNVPVQIDPGSVPSGTSPQDPSGLQLMPSAYNNAGQVDLVNGPSDWYAYRNLTSWDGQSTVYQDANGVRFELDNNDRPLVLNPATITPDAVPIHSANEIADRLDPSYVDPNGNVDITDRVLEQSPGMTGNILAGGLSQVVTENPEDPGGRIPDPPPEHEQLLPDAFERRIDDSAPPAYQASEGNAQPSATSQGQAETPSRQPAPAVEQPPQGDNVEVQQDPVTGTLSYGPTQSVTGADVYPPPDTLAPGAVNHDEVQQDPFATQPIYDLGGVPDQPAPSIPGATYNPDTGTLTYGPTQSVTGADVYPPPNTPAPAVEQPQQGDNVEVQQDPVTGTLSYGPTQSVTGADVYPPPDTLAPGAVNHDEVQQDPFATQPIYDLGGVPDQPAPNVPGATYNPDTGTLTYGPTPSVSGSENTYGGPDQQAQSDDPFAEPSPGTGGPELYIDEQSGQLVELDPQTGQPVETDPDAAVGQPVGNLSDVNPGLISDEYKDSETDTPHATPVGEGDASPVGGGDGSPTDDGGDEFDAPPGPIEDDPEEAVETAPQSELDDPNAMLGGSTAAIRGTDVSQLGDIPITTAPQSEYASMDLEENPYQSSGDAVIQATSDAPVGTAGDWGQSGAEGVPGDGGQGGDAGLASVPADGGQGGDPNLAGDPGSQDVTTGDTSTGDGTSPSYDGSDSAPAAPSEDFGGGFGGGDFGSPAPEVSSDSGGGDAGGGDTGGGGGG